MRKKLISSLLAGSLGLGCSGEPVESPRVPEKSLVVWTGDHPALGSVRWGYRENDYHAVSYPRAKNREDKTLLIEHEIPLLSVRNGERIHYRRVELGPDGEETVGEEQVLIARILGGPRLTWTMIDVGFGDAHLITLPTSGKQVLIDAGERRDWPNVDAFLKQENVRSLDVVIGTHIHVDHIGGLVGESGSGEDGILGGYPVGLFLDASNKSAPRAAYRELLAYSELKGIVVDTLRVGDTQLSHPGLSWDPLVSVEVLNSGGGRGIGGETENEHLNNDSIVLRLTYGEVDLLLGGDAEAPVEYRLVEEGFELNSEILKVHHHGVNDASTPAYLDAVDPRVALIPVATYETYFGSIPGESILNRFRARSMDIFASDRAEPLDIRLRGDRGHHVTVVTDGVSYEVILEESSSRHYPPRGVEGCLEDEDP